MIERMKPEYLNEVMRIWLDTNRSAHPFINPGDWEAAYDMVRQQLPAADLFVCQDDGEVRGFIGITGGSYIAGLFVDQQYQSRGIGRKLLDYCKLQYQYLELDVFTANSKAVRFYQRNGFVPVEKKLNDDFKQEEYHMIWPEQG